MRAEGWETRAEGQEMKAEGWETKADEGRGLICRHILGPRYVSISFLYFIYYSNVLYSIHY